MNLLLNLSSSYRESFIAGNIVGVDETSKGCTRPVPPYAELLGSLEALRQSDPVLYRQVKDEVAVALRADRQTGRESCDLRDWAKMRRRSDRRSINVWSHLVMDRVIHLAVLLFPSTHH